MCAFLIVEGDRLVLLSLGALHVGGECWLLGPVDHSRADREPSKVQGKLPMIYFRSQGDFNNIGIVIEIS